MLYCRATYRQHYELFDAEIIIREFIYYLQMQTQQLTSDMTDV